MTIETGGPAFPATHVEGGADGIGCKDGIWHFPGMTLRDYFAAKAMQSFIIQGPVQTDIRFAAYAENMATVAYLMADEMLKARGQE